MNAVDTNVLLYAMVDDEPAKRKQAREFLRQLGRTDEPPLLWQVLGSPTDLSCSVTPFDR